MHDLERRRGDTYADRFYITDGVGKPLNITGFSFKLTLDRRPEPTDSSTQVYQLTGVITDAANGVVEFAPTIEQANQVGVFHYDMQMTDAQSRTRTVVVARYAYKQDITK
jgi:hypothetical protein